MVTVLASLNLFTVRSSVLFILQPILFFSIRTLTAIRTQDLLLVLTITDLHTVITKVVLILKQLRKGNTMKGTI